MCYEKEAGLGKAKGIGAKALELYIKGHLYRQFRAPAMPEIMMPVKLTHMRSDNTFDRAADAVRAAKKPVIVIGSQTLVGIRDPGRLARALGALGAPVY